MNRTTITRRLEFDAGHRILNHEGKCANLHGHRYAADITVTAKSKDVIGRIIDFSVVKQKVGGWVDEYLDHTMILQYEDPLLQYARTLAGGMNGFFGSKLPHVVPFSTTAENLAEYLYSVSSSILVTYEIDVVKVRLWETPNCFADAVNCGDIGSFKSVNSLSVVRFQKGNV